MKRSLLPCLFLVACGAEPPLPPAPVAPPPVVTDASASAAPAFVPALPYPATRRLDQLDELHGTKVADPYRWLEDGKSDEVKQWASAQDGLARSTLAKLPGRQGIADRMKQLLYIESAGRPQHAGNRWMYSRKDAGKEKAIVYWREGRTGPEKVLLDPLSWSSDGSVSLGDWTPSLDGKKVAYAAHANNGDEATLYVLDVGSGKKSDVDVIDGAMYAYPSWTPSGDGFYYTWVPAKGAVPDADRPGFQEVRFHKLGSDPRKDRTVVEHTGDPTTSVSANVSRDGRWLLGTVQHGWNRSDVRFMDLRAPKPAWQDLAVGKDAVYEVSVDGGRFYVHTNDGAPNWRVLRVDPRKPARESWVEIIAERPDAMLESADVLGHELALSYLKDVVSQAELHDENGKLLRAIELPGIGNLVGLSGNADDTLVYYAFQSFTFPTKIFETDVKTGKTSPWYELKVPVDPSQFVVDQKFATSKDGTRVPFFVVHPKTMKTDGSTPTILTGYGGFQISSKPYFAASIYPWLEQGGAWVVANLRGGSEYGEAWHRHGMGHEKQNVFDDLFAVAQALGDTGVATSSKLAVLGGSNGGLLVGAAITQHPEMFRVALCAVPLLDMVRYPQFGQGQSWVPEYGNPTDAADFGALYAYSPYHHVTQGTKYPATLVLSADSDDRVDPMHARKFAAELQWASTGGPVLLRVEKHSGHGGADLVKASIEKVADEYAFALDQMK